MQQHADFLEKIVHTNPSGVDVQIVMNGGCLEFKKTSNGPLIRKFSVHPSKTLKFMLVNTNKQREGKLTIEKVLKLKQTDPLKFEEAMGVLGDVTSEIIECLGLESADPIDYF